MNYEYGWTKEMIDEIKDCEPYSALPILIKIQSTYYSFGDREDNFWGDDGESNESYEGIFNRDEDIWQKVDVTILFYDNNNRKFEELNSEKYMYGYLAFHNMKTDSIRPALTIGLNKNCGVKEKMADSFVKAKMFNDKGLTMDIKYDCEFIKKLEYENFITDKVHRNFVPIKLISLSARVGVD